MPTNPPAPAPAQPAHATTPATLDYDGLRALLDAPQTRVIDDWAEFVLPHDEAQCGPPWYWHAEAGWEKSYLPVLCGAHLEHVALPMDLLGIEDKEPDPLPQPAPGDYCEDAREVAPGVWEWRGRRYRVGWDSRVMGEDTDDPRTVNHAADALAYLVARYGHIPAS